MTDPEKKAEEKPTEKPVGEYTNKQLADAIRFLGKELKTIKDENAALREELKTKPAPKPKGEEREGPPDVELMTNSQLSEHIVKLVTEGMQPHLERLGSIETRVSTDKAQESITKLAEKDPHFWEFQDELKRVIKEHPDLTVEQAYVLAQSSNPPKKQELDKKSAEVKATEDAEKAKAKAQEFGGLLPTSGRAGPKEDMTIDEAAEAAFKELGVAEHLRAVSIQ